MHERARVAEAGASADCPSGNRLERSVSSHLEHEVLDDTVERAAFVAVTLLPRGCMAGKDGGRGMRPGESAQSPHRPERG